MTNTPDDESAITTELQQEIEDTIAKLAQVEQLEPWQRKLATEIAQHAAAHPDQAPISPALRTYLDARSLEADPGEILDEESED